MLLLAGLIFYGYWSIPFLGLLILTTIVDFVFAQLIFKETHLHKRKLYLSIPILSNIGVLFFFKYFHFFKAEFCQLFHITNQSDSVNIILPIGISFYTFQAMAYLISVYRQNIVPEKNIITYLTFITFFPQLMAGPIEKPFRMLQQFKEQRSFNYQQAIRGLELLLIGYLKKTVLADNLAIIANNGFDIENSYVGTNMWIAVLAFTFQIYFDFSGYSNIARGLSKLMGIELMQNFNNPYFSININDFWKRWHISISRWFKEYVYFSLGGNKKGRIREYINLLLTFAISGLWHGANITFIVWGLYHGLLSVLQKTIKSTFQINAIINMSITFLLVTIGWIFFRATNVSQAITIIGHLGVINFDWSIIHFTTIKLISIIGVLVAVLFFEYQQEFNLMFNQKLLQNKFTKYSLYYSTLLIILLFGMYSNNPSFIYFNF